MRGGRRLRGNGGGRGNCITRPFIRLGLGCRFRGSGFCQLLIFCGSFCPLDRLELEVLLSLDFFFDGLNLCLWKN